MASRGAPFLLLWAVVLAASGVAVAALGRYGANLVAFGFLYAGLATSWSWMRATGLFSLGHAAFFGVGALTQAWLVARDGASPWPSLLASAGAGALAAVPLIPALRLGPAAFGLATLAYAGLARSMAGNVRPFGMEGFLLPRTPGFEGPAPALLATLLALALAASLGYERFLRRPAGRCAAAIRQEPDTASSLGIDPLAERWRPLLLGAATAAMTGGLYAHLVGSVDTSVVFSPTFSILPLVLGMVGGALHPVGGVVGTLVLYPLDELILRPALPHAHTLLYGVALLVLLMVRPGGLIGGRPRAAPASANLRPARHDPFSIALAGVTVRRGAATVLEDVSFKIEAGGFLRVLGANGAGKTSLVAAIAGRLPLARGAILFGGTAAPRGAAARARRGLARTFQAPRPFGEWTVRENVALAAERAGNLGAVDGLLDELELTALEHRPASRLSVGEGKRLELARVLAFRPAVLVLDEPLAGLSPEAARRVSKVIERTGLQGVGVVWVEHGAAGVGAAGPLLVLEGGRIRFLGSRADWDAERLARSS